MSVNEVRPALQGPYRRPLEFISARERRQTQQAARFLRPCEAMVEQLEPVPAPTPWSERPEFQCAMLEISLDHAGTGRLLEQEQAKAPVT